MPDKTVHKQRNNAEIELDKIRMGMKTNLLQNNMFINDICKKMERYEGKLYVEIIKEILQENNLNREDILTIYLFRFSKINLPLLHQNDLS